MTEQEPLPGLSDEEILVDFSHEELILYKAYLLDKYSQIEKQVNLVNSLLDVDNENIVLGEN